jgi:hypothetical protein
LLAIPRLSPPPTATSDWDGDGTRDMDEYRAGTDPKNTASRFVTDIVAMRPQDNEMDISWPSATGRTYTVWSSETLVDWDLLLSGIDATPPTNTLTIETNPEDANMFFRVDVD